MVSYVYKNMHACKRIWYVQGKLEPRREKKQFVEAVANLCQIPPEPAFVCLWRSYLYSKEKQRFMQSWLQKL